MEFSVLKGYVDFVHYEDLRSQGDTVHHRILYGYDKPKDPKCIRNIKACETQDSVWGVDC